MKKSWLFAIACLTTSVQCLAQGEVKPDSIQQAYEQKKKTAKGLIIGGSVCLGASVAMGVVAMAQVTEEVLVPLATWQGDVNENAGEGAAVASTVLFIGGAALLTAGLIINGKANRMQRQAAVSLQPAAPPVYLAGRSVKQNGFSLAVRLGK